MRTRVYIAGPMSQGDRVDNLAQALKAFRELATLGYAPFCPQMTFFMEPFASLAHKQWLEIDLPWVAVADAVLRIPGESKGADEEVAFASAKGIPVFLTLEWLLKTVPAERPVYV